MALAGYIALIALTSIIIMYACNTFEDAADYLGRNMGPGVKGATINAIGSSLPELFTTLLFLFGPTFLTGGKSADELFSAGIATCAGSAVFNAVIIPGLCILAVVFIGVDKGKGEREKVPFIELNKKVIIKDGFFFLLSEFALIYFLGQSTLTYMMGLGLMALYVIYIIATLKGGFSTGEEGDGEGEDEDEDDEEENGGIGILGLGWLLDFNQHFFGGKELKGDHDDRRAWILLILATIVIGIACGGIVYAVEGVAHVLEVPVYFTAVIFAAAATSVPDTVLSVKDALKGEYDDAVANAVGSNIFDITVCLGLPLALYAFINNNITLTGSASGDDVQLLRFVLIIVSVLILAIFLIGNSVGKVKAILLFGLYFAWVGFLVGKQYDHAWTRGIQLPAFLSANHHTVDSPQKQNPKAVTQEKH